ncbi:hypothetical protein KQI84_03655 [bacterium]|nr:hypothetical protein [bacterium]
MPCHDVTEIVRIAFDSEDRLTHYSLIKKSCGQGVGDQSLILGWLIGRKADDMLDLTPEALLDHFQSTDEAVEYLTLKHFFALRSALLVYTGIEPGGLGSECVLESLAYEPEGVELIGRIRVDVFTDRIKGCARCCGGSCGGAKPTAATAKI